MDLVWGCIIEIVKRFNIKYEANDALWDNKLTKAEVDELFDLKERAIHRLFLDVERKDKRIEELKDELDKLRENRDFFKENRDFFREQAKHQKKTAKEYKVIIEELMHPWYKKLWNRLKSLKCPKISIEW